MIDRLVIDRGHEWNSALADIVLFLRSAGAQLELYPSGPREKATKPYLNYLLFSRNVDTEAGVMHNIIGFTHQFNYRQPPLYYEVIEDLLETIEDVNRCTRPDKPTLLHNAILTGHAGMVRLLLNHPSVDLSDKSIGLTPMELAILVLIKWVNILIQWDKPDYDYSQLLPPLPNPELESPPKPVNPPPVPEGLLIDYKPYIPRALSLERAGIVVHQAYTENKSRDLLAITVDIIKQLYQRTSIRPNLARLYYLYKELEIFKAFGWYDLVHEHCHPITFSRVEDILEGVYSSTPVKTVEPKDKESVEKEPEDPLLLRMLNGDYLCVDNKEYRGRPDRYLFKHIAEQLNKLDPENKVYHWQLSLVGSRDGYRYPRTSINTHDSSDQLTLICSKIYLS